MSDALSNGVPLCLALFLPSVLLSSSPKRVKLEWKHHCLEKQQSFQAALVHSGGRSYAGQLAAFCSCKVSLITQRCRACASSLEGVACSGLHAYLGPTMGHKVGNTVLDICLTFNNFNRQYQALKIILIFDFVEFWSALIEMFCWWHVQSPPLKQ